MMTLSHINLHDPHSFLGLHNADNQRVVRLFRPGASQVYIELFGQVIQMQKSPHWEGLFEVQVPSKTTLLDYRIYHQDGSLTHDPYAFLPTFGEIDAHLFNQGTHYEIYDTLGGRLTTHQECQGVKFAVWAPNAKAVFLVGDFNHWDGRVNPMRSMGASGVWEIFIPGLKEGALYKFEIHTAGGQVLLKADPYAYFSQLRPETASRLFDVNQFVWTDQEWVHQRQEVQKPLAIYEVHLPSWKPHLSSYVEIAKELASYCQQMGFTHVELLPLSEHPLDESWGYQVTGFYAVTSRLGTPRDFQFFVNHMHSRGIGVIMDWVPAHFPLDDFSLSVFDGTHLYEHADPRKGFHPHWNTSIFNYGRKEVSNFLIGSALFWLSKMHVDGIRVDAVASMLYLDYGREKGEWIPNEEGGNQNFEAIEFIKHLNSIVHLHFPGVLMCAEESTSFPGVSHPLEWKGLGFDLKWNMGWMNDTLAYFRTDPLYRHYHQGDLTFGLLYAFSERFILVLSHDEVVHGKGSLMAKMPGDDWQKFAQMRLLYSYMVCQPGKKLLFMGGEIGQWSKWNCKEGPNWQLLAYGRHQELQKCIKLLNHFYQKHLALWENDFYPSSFEWIDFRDSKNCVISYLRKGSRESLACVHNFTPQYIPNYFIPLSSVSSISEVMNTDGEEFGGSGKINPHVEIVKDEQGSAVGFKIELAPLATMIFEVSFGH